MAVEDITNYILVSNRIASSGQPNSLQFHDIAEAGYQAVINLAMPNSENAIPEEGNIVSSRNMAYVHMPVPFNEPSLEHLKMIIGIMEALSDKKVSVHCVVNKRASAFLYQYQRLVHGKSHEEAVEAMLPDQVWKRFMMLNV
ncbi:protein tyrosine phosphatase family protein [Methylomonas sp. MgM2]|jgi:protein tyrosine phosphatase (PTP) superfamily phosphohydrolase (DUF442 family)